jgi:hypothetical protein
VAIVAGADPQPTTNRENRSRMTARYSFLEVESKGTLGLPDSQQVVTVLTQVLVDQSLGSAKKLIEGRLVRKW